MPIYEYKCQSCSEQLEILQKISDTPLTNCPKCGKNSLEKVISSTQFQLKGTGWYATDFKNSGKPAKEKKDNATSSEVSEKTEVKKTSSDSE